MNLHHFYCSYFVTCDSKAHPIVILIYVLVIGKCTDVKPPPRMYNNGVSFPINNNVNMKNSTSTRSNYSIIYMIPHHVYCSYFVTCDSKAHPILILIHVLIIGKCTEYI